MADSAAPSAGRVLISYRREETAYAAGWLFNNLADRFGCGQIFKDIDSVEPGDNFVYRWRRSRRPCRSLSPLHLVSTICRTAADESAHTETPFRIINSAMVVNSVLITLRIPDVRLAAGIRKCQLSAAPLPQSVVQTVSD